MQTTLPLGSASGKTKMPVWQTFVMWGAGIFFLGFGLLTLDTAVSIWRNEVYFSLGLLDILLSPNFAWGGEVGYVDLSQVLSQYYAKSGRMVLHTALGGVVVGIGITQFVPALRRSRPTLHRRMGMVVAGSMALSMAGALAYLASSSINSIFSGPTFFAFLWGLAVLALFLLMQAALAIVARDFRSHMVWMAACFSTFMTAPLLRVDWILLGLWTPLSLQRANAATAPMVLVQAVLIMMLWLSFIGDKDQPVRMSKGVRWVTSGWPRWSLRLMVTMTAGIALYEGALLPLGLAPAATLRDMDTILPAIAWVWTAATLFAVWGSLDAWEDWVHGFQPSKHFLIAIAVGGCAAIWVGTEISQQTLDGFTWAFYWKCLGVLQLTALLLTLCTRPNSLGRNAWGVFSLFILWTPACMLVCVPALMLTALTQYEALIAGGTLAIGSMCIAGLTTAFGVTLRWMPGRTAAG